MNSKKNGSDIPARKAITQDGTIPEVSSLFPVPERDSLREPTIQDRLAAEIQAAGGEIPPDPELVGSIGTTMFDLPGCLAQPPLVSVSSHPHPATEPATTLSSESPLSCQGAGVTDSIKFPLIFETFQWASSFCASSSKALSSSGA
jgi:hypothetical protein